jgi:hypothetical protein
MPVLEEPSTTVIHALSIARAITISTQAIGAV